VPAFTNVTSSETSWLVHLADFTQQLGGTGRQASEYVVMERSGMGTSVLTLLTRSDDERSRRLPSQSVQLPATAMTYQRHSAMIRCPSNPNDTFNVKQ
jgi:hypothetical protein